MSAAPLVLWVAWLPWRSHQCSDVNTRWKFEKEKWQTAGDCHTSHSAMRLLGRNPRAGDRNVKPDIDIFNCKGRVLLLPSDVFGGRGYRRPTGYKVMSIPCLRLQPQYSCSYRAYIIGHIGQFYSCPYSIREITVSIAYNTLASLLYT